MYQKSQIQPTVLDRQRLLIKVADFGKRSTIQSHSQIFDEIECKNLVTVVKSCQGGLPCILESGLATSDHVEFVPSQLKSLVKSHCDGNTEFVIFLKKKNFQSPW